MYTPFSAGKTFGNQETKIIFCAFSHSIYSSPIQNLFTVSFGYESTGTPNAIVLRSDLFNQHGPPSELTNSLNCQNPVNLL